MSYNLMEKEGKEKEKEKEKQRERGKIENQRLIWVSVNISLVSQIYGVWIKAEINGLYL